MNHAAFRLWEDGASIDSTLHPDSAWQRSREPYDRQIVHVPRKIEESRNETLRPKGRQRRVLIFLAERGVKLPTVEVDMMKGENKGPEYLSKDPMETMPLLELDDSFTQTRLFSERRRLNGL